MATLKDRAQIDIRRITSGALWGEDLIFTAPDGTTATIKGMYTEHHLGVDDKYEKFVNTKNAHCNFSEKLLVDTGYPLRDAGGEVQMSGHRVQAVNSQGVLCSYVVDQWFPDNTVGLIVCILGDWTAVEE
jgi:hypothetical protein